MATYDVWVKAEALFNMRVEADSVGEAEEAVLLKKGWDGLCDELGAHQNKVVFSVQNTERVDD